MKKIPSAENQDVVSAGIHRSDYGYISTNVPASKSEGDETKDFSSDPLFNNKINVLRPSNKESALRRWYKRFALFVLLNLVLVETYIAISYFFPFLAYNSGFALTVFGYTLTATILMAAVLVGVALVCLLLGALVSKLIASPLDDINDMGASIIVSDLNLAQPTPGHQYQSQDQSFQWFYEFMKSEKLPAVLLAELKESSEWASQLSFALATQPKLSLSDLKKGDEIPVENPAQDKLLAKLAARISQRIGALKKGQSCLIPCGVNGQVMRSALLRVSHVEDNKYNVNLITRDKTINKSAVVNIDGKTKVLANMTFAEVPADIVVAADWLQALLTLQVSSEHADSSSLIALFTDLQPYQKALKADGHHFKKQADAGRLMQNLWDFVHEQPGVSAESAVMARRKLRFQVASLFLGHQKLDGKTTSSFRQRSGLAQAVNRIRQSALVMRENGHISLPELAQLDCELQIINAKLTDIERAKNTSDAPIPAVIKKNNNEEVRATCHAKPSRVSRLRPKKLDSKIGLQAGSIKVESYDFSRQNDSYSKPIEPTIVIKGDLAAICQQLENFKDQCDARIKKSEYLQCQNDCMAFVDALPFDVFIKYSWVHKADDVWGPEGANPGISELQHKAAGLITGICLQFTEAAKESKTLLPNRLVALLKLCCILDHLSRLNRANNDYKYNITVPGFSFIIKLVEFNHVLWYSGDRSRLALYQRVKPKELETLEYLKDYSLGFIYAMRRKECEKPDCDGLNSKEYCKCCMYSIHDPGEHGVHLKDSDWKSNILTAVDCLAAFVPGLDAETGVYEKNTFARVSLWGKPIASKALAAAGVFNNIECDYNKDKQTKDQWLSRFTSQEAMVDKPRNVFKLLLMQMDSEAGKLDLPEGFSKSELTDLLLSWDTTLALPNLIDILLNKPHLLLNPDVRRAFEIVLLDTDQFSSWNRPSGLWLGRINLLKPILEEAFELAGERQQIELALFIARLSTNIRNLLYRYFPNSNKVVEFSPTWQQTIDKWLQESLLDDSVLKPYRYELLCHCLNVINLSEQLNKQELHKMIYLNALLVMTPVNRVEYDPVLIDQFRQFFLQWGSLINETFAEDSDLLRFTMERICQFLNKPLPKAADNNRAGAIWTGQFPQYSAGEYMIDISTGAFYEKGVRFGQLPGAVVTDPGFLALFPDLTLSMTEIRIASTKNLEVYEFTHPDGVENRIELKDGYEVTFYRRNADLPWLCYAKEDPFVFNQHAEKLDLFSVTKNIALCPEYLLSDHLFVDPENDSDYYSFTQAGLIQFKLIFKNDGGDRVHLECIEDLRDGHSHQELTAIIGDSEAYPFLKGISRFEDPKQILLWKSQDKALKEIELVRSGLRFEIAGGRLHCLHPDFKDYYCPLPVPEKDTKYLPSALMLRSLSSEKEDIILVPKFGLAEFQLKRPDISLPMLASAVVNVAVFNQLPQVPEPQAQIWQFKDNEKHHEYHVFKCSQDANDLVCVGGNAFSAVIDLLSYLVVARQRVFNNSYQHLEEYLDQINRLGSKYFLLEAHKDQHQFIKLCQQLARLATGVNDGSAVALALRGLFTIRAKTNASLQGKLDPIITRLYATMLRFGKRVNTMLRLTPEQDRYCRMMLSLQSPELNVLTDSAEDKTITVVRENIERVIPSEKLKPIVGLAESLLTTIEELKEAETPPEFTFLRLNSSNVESVFKEVYEIIRRCDVKSLKFRQVWLSLKTLGGAPSSGWIAHLRILVDARCKNIEMELPKFPKLIFRPMPKNLDYMAFKEKAAIKAQYSKERSEALTKIKEFLTSVDHFTMAKDPYVAPPKKCKVTSKLQKEDIVKQGILLEKKAAVTVGPRIDHFLENKVVYPALFSKDELHTFFGAKQDVPEKYLKATLNLDQTLKHYEPCIKKMAQEIQEEIEIAKHNLSEKELRPINKTQFKQLKTQLNKKHREESSARQNIRKRIEKQLDISRGSIISLEAKAGYTTPMTWTNLLMLYYKRDLDGIREHLLPGMDFDAIIKELDSYFVAVLKMHWIDHLIKSCHELEKDDLLSDVFMGAKLHEMLTQPILTADPELILIQAISGFVFKKAQLKMVESLIKDETMLLQAPTGTGKTSVIMILLGRYKATGENLVTLKFLDPLLPSAVERLQSVLGNHLRQLVKPVLFDSSMPVIVYQTINKKRVRVSRFRQIYDTMQEIKVNKGVMVTNHKTGSLLVTKMLALLDKYSELPEDIDLPELAFEHVYFLAKIFDERINNEHVLIDEHDSFLNPTKEDHLRVDEPVDTPVFIWQTALEIFDDLLAHDKLGLSHNTQSELPQKERDDYRHEVAASYARKLSVQLSKEHNVDVEYEHLAAYLKGDSEEVLETFDAMASSTDDEKILVMCDALAVAKDLFTVFLKHTLAKKNSKHYMRHSSGVHTVPCERPGVASPSSEYDDIRERVCYLIADHYQQGISYSFFNEWFLKILRDANTERGDYECDSLNDTPSGKTFLSFFPDESLQNLTDRHVSRLRAKANKSPVIIRRFLQVLLPKLGISTARASSDAQNQVSQSFKISGVSATQGAVEGFHRRFNKSKACKKGVRGEMLLRMLGQLETSKVLDYDPSKPKEIISSLIKQHPAQVIIDGGGAMSELTPQRTAEQIQTVQAGKLKAVGYFDLEGSKQVWVPPENKKQSISMQETGFYYHASQARGADAVIAPLPAILLEDGQDTIEDINQHRGRLRKENHSLRLAVPKNSGIKTADDLLNRGLTKEALKKADYIYRSKRQELRDIVRLALIKRLVAAVLESEDMGGTDRAKLASTLNLMQQYRKKNILVTRKTQLYQHPGAYYQTNKQILREDQDSEQELIALRDQYYKVAVAHGLDEAAKELEAIDFEGLKAYLPRKVYPGSVMTDTAVEIQMNVDVAVEQDVTLTVDVDVMQDDDAQMPFYLPHQTENGPFAETRWGIHQYSTHLNSHYDPCLHFTENFLPRRRPEWAPSPAFFRKPHDSKQNRLAFVQIEFNSKIFDSGFKITAMDFLDSNTMNQYVIFDTRTRSVIDWGRDVCTDTLNDIYPALLSDSEKLENKKYTSLVRVMAQMRFEDGQMNLCPLKGERMGYSQFEFDCLKEWLLDIGEDMESYFVTDIMQYRQEELQKYPSSDLCKLFNEVRNILDARPAMS